MSDNSTSSPNTAPADNNATEANQVADGSQPDFSKMTGEEAKAWVEAQKAKQASNKVAPRDKYMAAESKKESNAVKEAAAEAKRKLKIGDEEVDEEEVLKIYKSRKEHQRAANAELQKAIAARKQNEEFLKMMKDPEKFFEIAAKMGHDPRDLAEKHLVKQLQDELMDPREKELRDAKNKLKEYEDLERRQKEEQERKMHETLKAKYAQEYNEQFISALKESGLPATKPMVAEMAKYISRSAKIGFKMTASEAAQLVMEDVKQAQAALIGNADGETLLKLLGPDLANKIRDADLKKLKSPEQVLKTPQIQGESNRERKTDGKRMTPQEWRKHKLGLK